MRRLLPLLRLIFTIAMAVGAGSLPACGSMGMKYFTEPPAYASS